MKLSDLQQYAIGSIRCLKIRLQPPVPEELPSSPEAELEAMSRRFLGIDSPLAAASLAIEIRDTAERTVRTTLRGYLRDVKRVTGLDLDVPDKDVAGHLSDLYVERQELRDEIAKLRAAADLKKYVTWENTVHFLACELKEESCSARGNDYFPPSLGSIWHTQAASLLPKLQLTSTVHGTTEGGCVGECLHCGREMKSPCRCPERKPSTKKSDGSVNVSGSLLQNFESKCKEWAQEGVEVVSAIETIVRALAGSMLKAAPTSSRVDRSS